MVLLFQGDHNNISFKYKRVMISCVIDAIINGVWLLVLIPTACIFNIDGVNGVPHFRACIFKGAENHFFAAVLPCTVNCIVAIILNAYLAKVAYQVCKQIEKETRLSGGSSSQDHSP